MLSGSSAEPVICSMRTLPLAKGFHRGLWAGSATTDELKAFGREERWQEAVLAYAAAYARRVEEYYVSFVDDVNRYGLTDEAEEIEEEGKVTI